MFSAELTKKPVLQLKRAFREIFPPLYRIFNDINAWMIKIRKLCEENREGIHVQKEAPKELYPLLQEFLDTADEWLSQNAPSKFREDLLTLYFDAYAFLRTSESYDERYATYFEKSGSDVKIKLFCLDPSYLLREAMKRGKAAILFSATLIPLNYFVEILGGDDSSQKLRLPSPFPRENLCLLLDARISTRYKMREHTYDEVTRMIYTVVSEKTGNYLVYFPSYQYMNEVCTRFQEQQTEAKVIIQQTGMSEEERESFLDQFSCPGQRSMVAFAVMGGVFGEGIDLTGDRLSGAIIVGVGLPQLCLERNIIRRYFDQTKGLGFEYAYVYPGMNKVLQAAGRVIRTEADRGVVLLIDDRFDTPLYRNLYPAEWNPISRITGPHSLSSALRSFWGEGNRQ